MKTAPSFLFTDGHSKVFNVAALANRFTTIVLFIPVADVDIWIQHVNTVSTQQSSQVLNTVP